MRSDSRFDLGTDDAGFARAGFTALRPRDVLVDLDPLEESGGAVGAFDVAGATRGALIEVGAFDGSFGGAGVFDDGIDDAIDAAGVIDTAGSMAVGRDESSCVTWSIA